MNLNNLLARDHLDCSEIASMLDSATHDERVRLTRNISRQNFQRLYAAVKGFKPISVDELVPTSEALSPVEHVGTNNLPLAREFSKVMYREPNGGAAGRNVQTLSWATGPGYFTVEPHQDGEVIINYLKLPEARAPEWPAITDNARGLSYFIYRGMHDVMRGISKHVTIGRARRFGKDLPNYFVLVRK
jgi:hypothetical protein